MKPQRSGWYDCNRDWLEAGLSPAAARRLRQETLFESACWYAQWNDPVIPGLKSAAQWERLIEKSIARACAAPGTTVRLPGRVSVFRQGVVWAAAAGIVLAVALTWWLQYHAAPRPAGIAVPVDTVDLFVPHMVAIARDEPQAHATPTVARTSEGQLRIVDPPGSRYRVVRLTDSTTVRTWPHTRLVVKNTTDTTVRILLTGGQALFRVQKDRYRSFEVLTPQAVVAVVGTVFRVQVDTLRTLVEVLEGAVRVMPLDTALPVQILTAGHEAMVSDSLLRERLWQERMHPVHTQSLQERLAGQHVWGDTTPQVDNPDSIVAQAQIDSFLTALIQGEVGSVLKGRFAGDTGWFEFLPFLLAGPDRGGGNERIGDRNRRTGSEQ